MKNFFETPQLLIGYPLLVVGLIGVVIVILAALAPSKEAGPAEGLTGTGGGPGKPVAGGGPGQPPSTGVLHSGPSVAEYVNIGVVLAAITGLEVAVYYVTALGDLLAPILIVLALSKFVLVVLFFMHLKFDNRLFTTMFTGGLTLAIGVFCVVLATLGASIT